MTRSIVPLVGISPRPKIVREERKRLPPFGKRSRLCSRGWLGIAESLGEVDSVKVQDLQPLAIVDEVLGVLPYPVYLFLDVTPPIYGGYDLAEIAFKLWMKQPEDLLDCGTRRIFVGVQLELYLPKFQRVREHIHADLPHSIAFFLHIGLPFKVFRLQLLGLVETEIGGGCAQLPPRVVHSRAVYEVHATQHIPEKVEVAVEDGDALHLQKVDDLVRAVEQVLRLAGAA